MYIKFWGTRGSIPVPGKSTLKFGGNTLCVEIRTDDNKVLVLDAGSGIRELGDTFCKNGFSGDINILLSHYHWDHIQGIPFFKPLYNKNFNINFYGMRIDEKGVADHLNTQMNPVHFPVDFSSAGAKISFRDVYPSSCFFIDDIRIETFDVNHSSPAVTYKVHVGEKKIVYMTDNELNCDYSQCHCKPEILKQLNEDLVRFCEGCDYLIHDSMYDDVSVLDKKGWGHSDNVSSAYFSILSKVKNLILFHYNPEYSDPKIEKLLTDTQQLLIQNDAETNCIAAEEGLEIRI